MYQEIKVGKSQFVKARVYSPNTIKITGDTNKEFIAKKLANDLIITYANGTLVSLLGFYQPQVEQAAQTNAINTVEFDATTISSTDTTGKICPDKSVLVASHMQEGCWLTFLVTSRF